MRLSSRICPDNFVNPKITRHYLTVNGRLVHYCKCGSGPPLLMIHQSPRSSAEYEGLMREWGAHFTCIAPDTSGFGQSAPLAKLEPDINDYADAIVEFTHALGIERTAAYGFHSGGIILVTALKRHPELFTGLAVGGYAIWNSQEMAIFGDAYLPPFLPSGYGEHLTWLWNRILEQSWFFPWFDVRGETRLSVAHDDPARVHAVIMEMLDAGDAYRLGYGAVLRAPRDIPPPNAKTCPVLITAYDGDPLQAHIDRLGTMPEGWSAQKLATPKAHQDASLAFLLNHAGQPVEQVAEDGDCGFIHIKAGGFDGLIHWRGNRHDAASLLLHAPGREMQDDVPDSTVCIDMPGHGLSDNWLGKTPTDVAAWHAVTNAACAALGAKQIMYRPLPTGDADRLFPDLTPDRYGHYLTKAWSIVRASQFFTPWYEANAGHAAAFEPHQITPEALAKEHRALLRARAAREMMIAYSTGEY
jgi:haloalkane dehalogenase